MLKEKTFINGIVGKNDGGPSYPCKGGVPLTIDHWGAKERMPATCSLREGCSTIRKKEEKVFLQISQEKWPSGLPANPHPKKIRHS